MAAIDARQTTFSASSIDFLSIVLKFMDGPTERTLYGGLVGFGPLGIEDVRAGLLQRDGEVQQLRDVVSKLEQAHPAAAPVRAQITRLPRLPTLRRTQHAGLEEVCYHC